MNNFIVFAQETAQKSSDLPKMSFLDSIVAFLWAIIPLVVVAVLIFFLIRIIVNIISKKIGNKKSSLK